LKERIPFHFRNSAGFFVATEWDPRFFLSRAAFQGNLSVFPLPLLPFVFFFSRLSPKNIPALFSLRPRRFFTARTTGSPPFLFFFRLNICFCFPFFYHVSGLRNVHPPPRRYCIFVIFWPPPLLSGERNGFGPVISVTPEIFFLFLYLAAILRIVSLFQASVIVRQSFLPCWFFVFFAGRFSFFQDPGYDFGPFLWSSGTLFSACGFLFFFFLMFPERAFLAERDISSRLFVPFFFPAAGAHGPHTNSKGGVESRRQ